MRLGAKVLFGVASIVYLGASVWLARLEQAGPVQSDLQLAGRIPATLYPPKPQRPAVSGSRIRRHAANGRRRSCSSMASPPTAWR